MLRTAYEVQRDFALSSGLRSRIIWDSLSAEQSDVLKQKIETLLHNVDPKRSNALQKQRNLFFDNVWQQRQYTNGTLFSAIIYVLVTEENDSELALQSTNFSVHPLFRTRKCTKNENSDGCCMIFIDEYSRVYANWSCYLSKNVLPKGTMIAPTNGIYTFNEGEEVDLETHPTAVTGIKSKLLSVGDSVACVGGLAATAPLAATVAFPVAAPMMMAATAVGVATTAYSTLRSITCLVDRHIHCQTTALTDSEARGSWLGVACGVVGLGASAATKVVSYTTSVGQEVDMVTKLAVNGINASALVISGSGVLNSVYHLYTKVNDSEEITGFDVLQLASSLLILTHSVNNFRTASKITNSKGSTMRQIIRSHTNKVFEKISTENVRLRGNVGNGNNITTSGNFDIVRILNEIPFKEALENLHKINTHLNNGVSAVTAIGAACLPNFITVGPNGNMELNLMLLSQQYGRKFVQHIISVNNFMDVFEVLGKYFCDKVTQFFMKLARDFVDEFVDRLDLSLNTFLSTELVIYRMLIHCVRKYTDFSFEYLESQRIAILLEVKNYFDLLKPAAYGSRKYKCNICKGAYYKCNL